MKTILMVRCKMDEYDYLARLNGLSVRGIEEKATSAYLSAYVHREIWENGRKRAAYYDLLLEQGRLPTFKLSVHEMERLLPKETTIQVAQDLKKRRLDLMQSAILKQLSPKEVKKIKQYMRHAPVGIFTLPAVEYALRRYARLKTHYRVPIEARDAAAKYLCSKLIIRAFMGDLNERFLSRLNDEIVPEKLRKISDVPVVLAPRMTVFNRLKNFFSRQHD